ALVECIIALGSNVGDRDGNLRRAISLIGARTRLVAASSIYETEPMYREDQAWFLNCVVVVETEIEPLALLRWLKEAEVNMGRDPLAERNAPRVIDMDILFYGERVISAPSLNVPHPGIAERAFVLIPLAEVRPLLVHPVLGKSVTQLLQEMRAPTRAVKRSGPLSGFSPSQPQRPEPPEASP
ncbi:MAG TPA: 2-amino-4-hydroxy-6-hydroxymethyldihydropteridine diphosphokinase, partial [Nitrososphaerales archaeon]|nr:2-amino-4-hydroxy-6-hydroxymethyldihydropteridine diphosphokinase [Nitrososphaerales archaeon]